MRLTYAAGIGDLRDLGKGMLGAMLDAARNPGRFKLENAKVGSKICEFTAPLRKR